MCFPFPLPPTTRSRQDQNQTGSSPGWPAIWCVTVNRSFAEKSVYGDLVWVDGDALGCIFYEVVKAHGSLSTALADAKADLAKTEATVESMVTAAKKAV